MLVGYKGKYKAHDYYYCVGGYISTPIVFIDKKQIEDIEIDASQAIENSIMKYIDKIEEEKSNNDNQLGLEK